MSTQIDHQLDGLSKGLIFKSSNQKTFSISIDRASLSAVWKGMLEVGSESLDSPALALVQKSKEDSNLNSNSDLLTEHEQEILVSLKSLDLSQEPSNLRDLQLSQLVTLLEMADKYQAISVGKSVEIESMLDHYHGNLFDKSSDKECLQLFYYARELHLELLTEISAKLCLGIEDVVDAVSGADLLSFTLKHHLAPLHSYCQRWKKLKQQCLQVST